MAKPVTPGRRDAEDFRSRPIVRHRFLLDRINVARDDTAIHVEPKLPLVHAADPAEANLPFADLAVPRARSAHDFVRPLDGFPQLRDLAHRPARRLADVEDFLLRDHRHRDTARPGATYLRDRVPN